MHSPSCLRPMLGELLALAIGGSARGAPSSQDPELNLTGHTLVTFALRD